MLCASVREEIFGPVMSVLVFDDDDEAIMRANATHFGLGAGLITKDLARAHRMSNQLEAGNVWVNSYNIIPARFAPLAAQNLRALGANHRFMR